MCVVCICVEVHDPMFVSKHGCVHVKQWVWSHWFLECAVPYSLRQHLFLDELRAYGLCWPGQLISLGNSCLSYLLLFRFLGFTLLSSGLWGKHSIEQFVPWSLFYDNKSVMSSQLLKILWNFLIGIYMNIAQAFFCGSVNRVVLHSA